MSWKELTRKNQTDLTLNLDLVLSKSHSASWSFSIPIWKKKKSGANIFYSLRSSEEFEDM